MVQLSHLYMTTGKTTAFTIWIFVGKVMLMARLFSMLFSFPSKEQVSFNWWMAAFIVQSGSGAQEKKICHCFCFSPIYFPWSDGTGFYDLSFLNVEFQASFWLSSFTLIKRLFCSFSLSAIRVGKKDNKQCKQRVRRIIRMSLVEMPKQNIRDWLS